MTYRGQLLTGVNILNRKRLTEMIWTIVIGLLILWAFGWGFHVAGSLIHGFLVLALALTIFNVATRRQKL